MAEFTGTDLRGSEFRAVDLRGSWFRDADMGGVVMRGVELVGVDLDGRYPDRPKMRPTDPAGFREAWDVVERLWEQTVDRARRLDPALLHESVAGEWSF